MATLVWYHRNEIGAAAKKAYDGAGDIASSGYKKIGSVSASGYNGLVYSLDCLWNGAPE